jgi:hydantoinase/carbamoylase family amidase
MTSADGQWVMAKLAELARFSDDPGQLTRLFLSPAHRLAANAVGDWMADAGMTVRTDTLANVIGRYEGATDHAPALVIGSHIDTVRDAGWYDGNLGVILGIAAIHNLSRQNIRLPFALEVIAFGDEENLRFPTTLLGSRAMAGKVALHELDKTDSAGLSVAQELIVFGCDPTQLAHTAREREEIAAYIEVHIEQGPVLDNAGLALGIVTAINGATRWRVQLIGTAGHSGTVPMNARRDALAGFAEMAGIVEMTAHAHDGLVATIGQVTALPGAANVIPGQVNFTLDVRHADDPVRKKALAELADQFASIAKRRDLEIAIDPYYESAAAPCDPRLQSAWADSLKRLGLPVHHLPSGAGHDGLAFSGLWPISMLFVRCDRGISHNPAESMTTADAHLALDALMDFIAHFNPAHLA